MSMCGPLRDAPAFVLHMLWRGKQFMVLVRVLLRVLAGVLDEGCDHLHVCDVKGGREGQCKITHVNKEPAAFEINSVAYILL